MRHYILIPGFEGSALQRSGFPEAWPPRVDEVIFGYSRLGELLHVRNKATLLIDAIGCYPVYKPLRQDLQTIAQHHGGTAADYPYDWRVSVRATSTRLSVAIEAAAANHNHITLVAHSGGGLVARHVLENARNQKKSWFPKVKKLVTIGTPHLGAPTILFKALGMEGSLGISPEDVRYLLGDKRYPAPYQALPRPGHAVAWDLRSGTPQATSIYDPTVVAYLGLSPKNISAAKTAWGVIALAKKPATVEYIMIAGTNQKTDGAVQFDAHHLYPVTDYGGDGVVPSWSAAPPGTNSHAVPGDHTGMFKTQAFRQILYAVLEAPMPAPLIHDDNGAAISFNQPVYAPGVEASVLLIPDQPTSELDGTLTLRRMSRADGPEFEHFSVEPSIAPISISYRGPTIEFLRFQIAVPKTGGAYQLSLSGSHRTNAVTAGSFAVSEIARPNFKLSRERTP